MTRLNVNAIQNTSGVNLVTSSGGHVVDTKVVYMTQQLYVRSDVDGGGGSLIPGLSMCVTPKKSSNIIICEWMISGETYNDNMFVVHKKVGTGTWAIVTDGGQQGYNNDVGNVRWSGIVPGWYDPDFSSTPQTVNLQYHFVANTTSTLCLGPAIRSTSTSYWNPINRTYNSTGQTSYENSVSTGYLFEIST